VKEEDTAASRPWCGIGGASGNETVDEGSNNDGVRTEPRSDFHSYSEITGGGALRGSRSFDEHPIISHCEAEYTLATYIFARHGNSQGFIHTNRQTSHFG